MGLILGSSTPMARFANRGLILRSTGIDAGERAEDEFLLTGKTARRQLQLEDDLLGAIEA